jgi:hypothetical protein
MNKIYNFQPIYFRLILILLYLLRLVFQMVFYLQVYGWKVLVFLFIFFDLLSLCLANLVPLCLIIVIMSSKKCHLRSSSLYSFYPPMFNISSALFSRSPAGVIIRISYFSRHGLDRHGIFEDSVLVGSSLYSSLHFSSFIDGYTNRHH